MFLPRFLIVTPFFPWAFLLLSYLYGYLVSLGIKNHAAFVPWVIALSALAINIIGFVFARYKFESMREFKFIDYFHAVGQSLLDIGAVFACIISLVTVIRIPFMFGMFSRKRTVRTQLYLNVLLIIPDLLCLPLFLVLCVFYWRFVALKRDFNKPGDEIAYNFSLRIYVVWHFLKLLWDLFVHMLAFVLIFTPWRIKRVFTEFEKAKNMDEHTLDLFVNIMGALLDLIVIIIFTIFVVCTLYRLYFAARALIRKTHDHSARLYAFYCVLFVLYDVVVLFCAIFVLLTVFRVPRAWSKMMARGFYRYNVIIPVQFLRLMRDLPFILMGLFITILVWRAPFMLRDVFATPRGHDKRRAVLRHFGMLFVDLIDTPFVLASLIIFITVWRAPYFIRAFPKGSARSEQRRYVLRQFLWLMLDIPSTIALFLVIITVYRAKATISSLKEHFSSLSTKSSTTPAVATPSGPDDEDNPAPRQSADVATSWHSIVGKQFLLLIIDIPFPILLLLTLWRLPILVGRLKEIDDPTRKYLQRRLLILRYLLYVLFDILCLVPLLLILVTGWRIPSLVKAIRSYKRGDNEHVILARIFANLIIDIPFVVVGLFTMLLPWRGPFLVKSVYQDCKSDREARILSLFYLAAVFTDFFNLVLISFVTITVWRIPSLVRLLKKYISTPVDYGEKSAAKWHHTWAVSKATTIAVCYVLLDMLAFTQSLVIFVCVAEVRNLLKTISEVRQVTDKFDFDDVRPLLSFYFMETLRDIPHLFFLPLKAIGLVFFPIHLFLAKRTKSSTQSFLKMPLIWLHELAIEFMTFLEFDKFATVNLIGGIITIPNELGFLLVLINALFMFVVTLGSPLWNDLKLRYNWTVLGTAQGPVVVLEYITVILQSLLFPVFLAIQLILLLLPLILGLGLYNVERLSFVDYWHAFFTSGTMWRTNIYKFHGGVWFAQAFWVLVMLVCWNITFIVAKKVFVLFSPVKAYYWLVKKVFAGKVWGAYKSLLAGPTHICYRLRRVCLIGEILMFPLFLTWTCWPLIIPIVTRQYYVFIPCGLVTGFLIVMSYFIIRNSWGEVVVVDEVQRVDLTGVFVDIPDDGGIIFTFQGTKAHSFTITDARLSLVGDEIWSAIEKAIGKTKVRAALMFTGYPISLCPMFLKVEDINQQQNNITFSLAIGVKDSSILLKKKILLRTIESITRINNPTFDFVIEYGKKDFGWKKQGILCKYNTSLSIIMEAGLEHREASIPIPDQQHNNHHIQSDEGKTFSI
eukprot:gene4359-5090_t